MSGADNERPASDDAAVEARLGALDFAKGGGLLPAVVQHAGDGRVLMLGYMNRDALERTRASGFVTFYSRSRQTLWTKGETSGHRLRLQSLRADCDGDTLLVSALPAGPTCHLGTATCFDPPGDAADAGARDTGPRPFDAAVLAALERVIDERARGAADAAGASYVAKLLARGPGKVAQKIGEEGVETALALVGEDDAAFAGEAADLVFHLLVGLRARGLCLADVVEVLAARRR